MFGTSRGCGSALGEVGERFRLAFGQLRHLRTAFELLSPAVEGVRLQVRFHLKFPVFRCYKIPQAYGLVGHSHLFPRIWNTRSVPLAQAGVNPTTISKPGHPQLYLRQWRLSSNT